MEKILLYDFDDKSPDFYMLIPSPGDVTDNESVEEYIDDYLEERGLGDSNCYYAFVKNKKEVREILDNL